MMPQISTSVPSQIASISTSIASSRKRSSNTGDSLETWTSVGRASSWIGPQTANRRSRLNAARSRQALEVYFAGLQEERDRLHARLVALDAETGVPIEEFGEDGIVDVLPRGTYQRVCVRERPAEQPEAGVEPVTESGCSANPPSAENSSRTSPSLPEKG